MIFTLSNTTYDLSWKVAAAADASGPPYDHVVSWRDAENKEIRRLVLAGRGGKYYIYSGERDVGRICASTGKAFKDPDSYAANCEEQPFLKVGDQIKVHVAGNKVSITLPFGKLKEVEITGIEKATAVQLFTPAPFPFAELKIEFADAVTTLYKESSVTVQWLLIVGFVLLVLLVAFGLFRLVKRILSRR